MLKSWQVFHEATLKAQTETHQSFNYERFMEKGGFLTPHKFVDTSKYASDTFRGLHDILQNATTFRFDGSDLMPGWVGAGSFWTGMVDYTNGKSAKEVADAIQASWEAGQ